MDPSIKSLYKSGKINNFVILVEEADNMIKSSITILQVCAVSVIGFQLLVPVLAFKKTNVDQFTFENQRTRMRQNYVLQRALKNRNNVNNIDVTYVTEPLVPNRNPGELPALIVDYANMIRNDIILLDNSVETRTRKRGNIKVEKYDRSARDVPCSCELESKEPIILGDDYVPRSLETKNCNIKLCPSFYGCQQRSYNITVLKRRRYNDRSEEELPDDLNSRWIAVKKPVTIGCVCMRDSVSGERR